MPAPELALMLHVAMEIEEPIVAYSRQTGEGFRVLLPALSRFMGRSEAQARLAEERGEAWCESCWCAEERRHAPAFARLIERVLAGDLDGLAHAGLPGSVDDRQTRRRIRRVASGPLRIALTGRLRHHQIALNRYELARPGEAGPSDDGRHVSAARKTRLMPNASRRYALPLGVRDPGSEPGSACCGRRRGRA